MQRSQGSAAPSRADGSTSLTADQKRAILAGNARRADSRLPANLFNWNDRQSIPVPLRRPQQRPSRRATAPVREPGRSSFEARFRERLRMTGPQPTPRMPAFSIVYMTIIL
jgi:hypothetical protein